MNVSVFPRVPTMVSDHIHAAIARAPHERIGPFLAAFDADSADVGRNYAVPDENAKPSRHDITALIAAFEQRDRIPRLEYVPTTAPEVEEALTTAGFTVEGRPPIMVSTPDVVLTPRAPAGVALGLASADRQLVAAATAQHEAYLQPDAIGAHDVARLRSTLARGGLVAVASDAASGAAIGSGLVDRTGPLDSIGELAAVGVLAEFRRRGVASALSVYLARAAHKHGMQLVWLEAAPEEEQIYTHAGFITAGQKLWISLK